MAGSARDRARRLDQHPALLAGVRRLRERLPGDASYGDPLSTAGGEQLGQMARLIADTRSPQPGALRETGLGALQVWQSWLDKRGRPGSPEVAVLFTDIVGFSAWSLDAGDDETLRLLRDVGRVIDPLVRRHGGDVVKWLGDGLMAVFDEPAGAIAAALESRAGLRAVAMGDGHPVLRSGVHFGSPRKLGGDWLGVDVTIAARLAQTAGPDELLVSAPALKGLPQAETERLRIVLRSGFEAPKGVPEDLMVYAVAPSRR